jgi:hypothetical protein
MSLNFMGETFEAVEQLRKVYPAFCGNDAIRAIRAGAATPHEVEVYVYQHSAAYRQRKLAAARQNGQRMPRLIDPEKKAQQRRARGGAKTATTARSRAA